MNRTNLFRRLSLSTGVLVLGGMAVICGGCANDAQTGLLLGTGAGAGVGAAVGHGVWRRPAEGAAIGAGVGALSGYIIGNESDKAKAQQHPSYRY